MKKIIVGNWKMNPLTMLEAKNIFKTTKNIASKIKDVDIVVCPPYVYLSNLLNTRKDKLVSVGAQDVFFEEQGSFTGYISSSMLKGLGVSHVIIGHSERRIQGEMDHIISKKVLAVLESGLTAILCIGEKERNDQGSHLDFLKLQIKNSLNKVPKRLIDNLIIAYEPVWAIGAKEAMSPDMIHEMSIFVKKVLSDIYGHDKAVSTLVLYGGSVNFRNARDIIKEGGVDGLLVGRESISPVGFVELLKSIENL